MDPLYALEFDSPPFPPPGHRRPDAGGVLGPELRGGDRAVTLARSDRAIASRDARRSRDLADAERLAACSRSRRAEPPRVRRPRLRYPDQDERYLLLEQTIEIALHLWSGDRSPFRGPRHTLIGADQPSPAAPAPHPPILIARAATGRRCRRLPGTPTRATWTLGSGPRTTTRRSASCATSWPRLRGPSSPSVVTRPRSQVTALRSINLAPARCRPAGVDVARPCPRGRVVHAIVNIAATRSSPRARSSRAEVLRCSRSVEPRRLIVLSAVLSPGPRRPHRIAPSSPQNPSAGVSPRSGAGGSTALGRAPRPPGPTRRSGAGGRAAEGRPPRSPRRGAGSTRPRRPRRC